MKRTWYLKYFVCNLETMGYQVKHLLFFGTVLCFEVRLSSNRLASNEGLIVEVSRPEAEPHQKHAEQKFCQVHAMAPRASNSVNQSQTEGGASSPLS